MPLNMTFPWCTWGHWVLPVQLQVLVLCFCGLSEAVGNKNLVCISLFKALKRLLYLQEWVFAESWDQRLPSSWGNICAQRISKSLHLKPVLHPDPRMLKASSYKDKMSSAQGERPFQLGPGGRRTVEHILCVPPLKSWSKLRIPPSWVSLCHTCGGDGNGPFLASLTLQRVPTAAAEGAGAPCSNLAPVPGCVTLSLLWVGMRSFLVSFPFWFSSKSPRDLYSHVLFAGVFGCDTRKEGISAREEISPEDLRMRKSNYHSAIIQHNLFNFQSHPQRWLQVGAMSLVTLLKQLGLSKPVWHLYRPLFCFMKGKYKFSRNLICRTKLLK